MKRTTIRLDDQLLEEAKSLARQTGTTFTDLVADCLREALVRAKATTSRTSQVDLPVFRGNGLQPGVSLDHTSQLLDLMDGFDGPNASL